MAANGGKSILQIYVFESAVAREVIDDKGFANLERVIGLEPTTYTLAS